MTCETTRELLSGYLDDELDAVSSLRIEQHVESCDACAASLDRHEQVRRAVAGAGRFTAPTDLYDQVRASLARETLAASGASRFRIFTPRALALAASVAIVVAGAWLALRFRSPTDHADLLASQVVSSHVRSLMADHLTDVASSDHHTVKPWFQGKLDFAPPVRDFKEQGFELSGGRLDYLDDRPVAALVYRHGPHVINLFVLAARAGEGDGGAQFSNRQGYGMARWTRAGLEYWIVSNLGDAELRRFAALVEDAAPQQTIAPNDPPAAGR